MTPVPSRSTRESRRLKRLVAAFGALLLVACLDTTILLISEDDIASLGVSPDSTEIAVGRTLQLSPVAVDARGTLLVGQDIGWTSVDPSIAAVSDAGLVSGIAAGTASIVVSGAGLQDTATVVVSPPPVLALAEDSLGFTGSAGGADPGADSIAITNGGVFPLTGLAVDSILYGVGAEGWLSAGFATTAAPTMLGLSASVAGITVAGTYTATVWVSATDAEQSPADVAVTLTVTAGTPATMSIQTGDGQTATVASDVPVAPSVLLVDAFDNPVGGASVAFAVTDGGGSVTGGAATTDASGIAAVSSWTVGTMAGANALEATTPGVTPVSFTATGSPGPATQLVVVQGDGQDAVAGSSVTTAPSVEARDQYDNSVTGIDVAFSVESGGGSVTGALQTTDGGGIASAGSWTLGTTAGANTLIAVAASIPDTATFTATALPGDLDEIVLVAGDAQTDTVGATLAVYQVRVEDVFDNGIPGVTVTWTSAGGGSIDPTSDSDASGIASATRVLGTTVGTQTAQAAIGGLAPVDFTATADPGTPALISASAGTGQNATVDTPVTTPPAVLVTDQFGNAIAGHQVTFAVGSGGGSVVPTTSVPTDASGVATATSWTLGTVAAALSDTLEVTAAGAAVAPSPLLITATATAGSPASILVDDGDGQTAVSGTTVATDPTARVEDQFGNVVQGATVDFSTTGGSVGSASVVTDVDGLASTTWTVDVAGGSVQTDGTFPNVLDADVQGTAISVSFDADAVYGYGMHVDSIFVNNCTGCHIAGHVSGFFLDGTPTQNHAAVTSPANCSAGFQDLDRISSTGGTTGANSLSALIRMLDAALSDPTNCTHPFPWGAPQLEVIRAWARNSAPFN